MIGTIPNPKKSITIDRPSNEVREALKNMHLFGEKYKFTKSNDVLNQVTYEATEFLSVGVYIDFNYSAVAPDRTELQIEIRRKIGSFDKPHEVSAANQHFVKITDLLSTSLTTDPATRLQQIEDQKREAKEKQDRMKAQMEEDRKNHPVKYYTTQAVMIIIVLAIIAGIGWVAMKGCK